jgi:hypothetical protein
MRMHTGLFSFKRQAVILIVLRFSWLIVFLFDYINIKRNTRDLNLFGVVQAIDC